MNSQALDRIRLPAALWEGLKRAGIAGAEVVHRARLPVSVLRDGAPVSTVQFFALWQSIAESSEEPAIGLRIASGLDSAVLPVAFLAAYHARSFRDALQRVARFKRLCAPEEVVMEEHADQCDITVNWTHAAGQPVPAALVDATLVSLVELGRKGSAANVMPMAVVLARPESARVEYENYFGCRVQFGTGLDRLTLHRRDLDRPFVSYNAELLGILIPELDRRLDQQAHAASLAEQIKWVLRRRLTAGRPDIRSVATELAMSERSLQRKLTDEGKTFQSLLSETCHQLALQYLTDASLAIVDVAYMLGYEDQNSFFRAFRQWEAQTPSAWRAAVGKRGAS